MYILGISGGVRQGNQDGSATLLKDGRVIAAVEEERLMRIKHAPGMLPEKAVRYVLQRGGISITQVDRLVFPGVTYLGFDEILSRYFKSKFGHCPEIEFVHHHDAHGASAYYASGFENAMILTADLSGDGTSTQLSVGENGKIRRLRRFPKPNSLGIFYSLLTQFVGFQRDNDEYKVMGLSSYGRRGSHDLNWLLSFGDGTYDLNTEVVRTVEAGQPNPSKQEPMYNEELIAKLGEPRIPGGEMTSFYEDIAASGQEHLENAMVDLVTSMHKETGLTRLCLAGGVALNCVASQRLMNLEFMDEIYVQPAASDAGLSLGACYMVSRDAGVDPEPLPDAYLGPDYTEGEILEALELTNVRYTKEKNVPALAAESVAGNKIVGWFQGRMEFGPRALGHRSILANPCNPQMQDVVNERIKFREKFRPFTPSVLEEEAPKLFAGKMKKSPYMTITYDARNGVAEQIPSVVHVDNTVRIQTVSREQNALYYDYLQELKTHTSHGVTLNTSFNVKGEAVVNTPYHALATFYGSGMDVLIIGDYVVRK